MLSSRTHAQRIFSSRTRTRARARFARERAWPIALLEAAATPICGFFAALRASMATSRASTRARLTLGLAVLLIACGASAPKPPATLAPPPETNVGPLAALLPKGPELVLLAKPKQLAQQESARALWRSVVAEDRERAFAARTGVDPLLVEELVAFEVPPSGYVLLARGPFAARDVVLRARDRLAVVEVAVDEPILRIEGLAGRGRYAYAALDSHAVLVARDVPPQLVAAILLRRGDVKAERLFDAADAHALYTEHARAPLALFAPAPLQLPEGLGVSVLLAEERALAVAFVPKATSIDVAVDLRGEFPPGAEHNFRTLVQNIALTPLGAALGLVRAAESMRIRTDAQGVLIEATLVTNELLAGTRLVLFEQMRELFE